MSIEKITSKIISDAKELADAKIKEANNKSDAIIKEATRKAEKISKESSEKGLLEKEKIISRKKSVAEIDGRKLVLEEKQILISQCFEKAVDKIVTMERDQYVDFLAKVAIKTGEKTGELILNKDQSETIGNDLVAKIKELMPESKIVLAKETRDIKGGFLLRNGSVYINGTIEALVEDAKEELIGDVAKKLFQ
ncbi:MAG: V-type ATP synthase subunit E [Eubacteriales bacterium]|jgi:V/A-type H+-transporting ATPase subunit E|nr:V-type ATP synthase subunit E [Eubacteriales bacterium]